VADRFVRTTRFDPLKLADSEQSLYDRLQELVRRLRTHPEADLSMTAGGREYTVSVSASDVVGVSEASCHRVAGLVKQASGDHPTTVVLTDRAAMIPGLAAVLERMGFRDVVELAPGAAAAGALSVVEQLAADGDEVAFVTAVHRNSEPGRARPSTEQPRADSVDRRSGATPSHIVYRGRALAVGSDPLVFGVATGGGPRTIDIAENTAGISRSHCTIVADEGLVYLHDHSSYGTFLNGDRIEGRAQLVAGDRVRLGTPGVTLEAVVVVD
jgi:hypothetical protein